MTNDAIVPLTWTGEIINGRLIGEPHKIGRYWKYDWSCVEHGTTSQSPMRLKDMRNKKGPLCCRKNMGSNNPNWKGHKDIPMKVFNQAKNGAKSRNHSFNITIEDMQNQYEIQNKVCKYTMMPIVPGLDASLDRIDSKIGYEVDNIQWVHKDVNMAKQGLSDFEFVWMCILVSGVFMKNIRPLNEFPLEIQ